MISVIIPAHDEAQVIDRTLRVMLENARPGDLEVIVVCNGCTDDTAEIARSHGVVVLETPVASKPHALNLGDRRASAFPRAYIDADVDVSAEGLRTVAAVLKHGVFEAAAPAIALNLDGCSRAARAYYRHWLRTPYVTDAMIGSGVYMLSQAGRERFADFPDIIADDLFVRNHFAAGERVCVTGASFTKRAPKDLRTVMRIKGRMYLGHRQLSVLPDAPVHGESPGPGAHPAPRSATDIVDRVVYETTNVVGRLRAAMKEVRGSERTWERDETTRTVAR